MAAGLVRSPLARCVGALAPVQVPKQRGDKPERCGDYVYEFSHNESPSKGASGSDDQPEGYSLAMSASGSGEPSSAAELVPIAGAPHTSEWAKFNARGCRLTPPNGPASPHTDEPAGIRHCHRDESDP